ncbi:hypothetical protein ACFFK0_08360 [Paenibacillus chartarius]|uniref:WxL domain-containing protein n=1 Tax=Paenibacillus chartarius TaxID=747481 RepID=A0ABV6DIJ2_9BACL
MRTSFSKKVISAALLMSLVFGSAVASADKQIDPDSGSTVDVEGTASATTIVVTMPTVLSFAINPNNVKPFTSVPATVVNSTYAPVDVQILGITSANGTDTKVVDAASHTDQEWSSLGRAATTSQIALGLESVSGTPVTVWSPAEIDGVTPSVAAGTFPLQPDSSEEIQVVAKHGNAWDVAKTLNYKLYVRVALTEG